MDNEMSKTTWSDKRADLAMILYGKIVCRLTAPERACIDNILGH